MDTLALGGLDCLRATINVLECRARQTADHGFLGTLGDLLDGSKIPVRGDRETGLDNVDAHVVEKLSHFELLFVSHGRAGALLTVTQGGVKDNDMVLVGLGSHENDPSRQMRRLGALW